MLTVLLPDPLEVADLPPLPTAVAETVTDWVRVETRLIVAPVSTPVTASNCSSAVLPRLASSLLVLPALPSVSVTEALSLNDTVGVT